MTGKKQNTGILIAVITLVVALAVILGTMIAQIIGMVGRVQRAREAIDGLGKITMESLDTINDTQKLLDKLTDSERKWVKNQDTLTQAQKEYKRLEDSIQTAKDALDAVETPITVNSRASINKAREAFDALKADNLTGYVQEEEEILSNFENLWADEYALSQIAAGEELDKQGQYAEAMEAFYDVMDNYPSRKLEASERAAETLENWAQACYDGKDYESTGDRLEEAKRRGLSSDGLSAMEQKLEKKLASIRPTNGKTIKKSIDWGYGEFKVTAGDQDLCYKLENLDNPEKYAVIFVRKNETATIKVKDGRYMMKYTVGDTWYGNEEMFGRTAQYAKINEVVEYETTRSGSWVYYSSQSIDLSEHSIGDPGIPAISGSQW